MQTVQALAREMMAVLDPALPAEVTQSAITRVAGFKSATADALIFIDGDTLLADALKSGAGAIVAPLSVEQGVHGTPILRVKHPKLAFARAARLLAAQKSAGIDPSAIVGRASVGAGTFVGAGCVVADDVTLGRDCILYPRVTIYAGTTLGDRVVVHAGAVLGSDGFGYVRDPENGEYVQFPQQGTLIIEDDVEIGANTTIDRGALDETRIGRGTKIDNLVHVGHNVRIGRNVVIAAQTGISGSTVIGNGAVIGGHVGMGDHASVGEGVIVGSGAGILPHKRLEGPGQMFWGVPAKPLKTHLRELATLARLARKSSDRAPGEAEE